MIGQKKRDFSAMFLIAAAVFLMYYSLSMPERAAETVRRSLSVFVRSVLPSLALFSVCAKILVKSGIAQTLSALPLDGFFRAFGVSAGGFSAFIIGSFAGFPTGASVLAELCRRNEMDAEEAASILPFCNQSGASFVIGAVGASLFRDRDIGIVLFLAQTASATLALLLTAEKRSSFIGKKQTKKRPSSPVFSIVTSSVCETAFAMLSVCGFIVFFSLCTSALWDTLSASGIDAPEWLRIVAGGLLELSSGLALLADSAFSRETAVVLGGLLLGFGGVSVFLQALERTEAFFLSPKRYFFGKTLCAFFCPCAAYLFFTVYQWKNSILSCFFTFLSILCLIFALKNPFPRKIKVFFKKVWKN